MMFFFEFLSYKLFPRQKQNRRKKIVQSSIFPLEIKNQ